MTCYSLHNLFIAPQIFNPLIYPYSSFHLMNLFSEPFNFKKNYLLSIEDKVESHFLENKFLYLFSRKQISEFVKIKTSGHK